MVTVTPTGAILGAVVEGIDLSQPLDDAATGTLLRHLGAHGFLRFPGQKLEPAHVKAFSLRFGDIQETIRKPALPSDCPGVGILSNIKENGAYIGSPDAGQNWHTDMTYRDVMGL